MKRHWPHLALAVLIVLLIVVFSACSLTGPTCKQYLDMDDAQQREAALDWLVFNDMVDDRTSTTVEVQVPVAQAFLVAQCEIQVQQDIPTTLNQFRP